MPGVASMLPSTNSDFRLLFSTRLIRLFCYGFLSVILALYLAEVGLTESQIGLMFTELDDCVKINFRSRGDIPVNRLAQQFGGNGHLNAAGARVRNADLTTLRQDVIDRALHLLT